ncbi:hypothetical protein CALVIDRAFT_425004 [Calocera viscosa TUFC12733]|uniref:Uncharacterized protein n=1 Tax=Calocera viscosa (strain TUFC12733) TaxID=1330018 RepID=A0A167PJ94_CALVF|nr:hypothetical protein CALVIDRAFT_425004 [Calocera viscosa TUFC12733]
MSNMDEPSTSTAGRAPIHRPISGILRPVETVRRPVLTIPIPIPEEPVQTPVAFHRLVRNFALVPALSILEFLIAAAVLLSVPHGGTHEPDVLAILLAIAFWSLSQHLGPPLFRIFDTLTTALPSSGAWSETVLEALSTLIHVALKEFARFTAVLIFYKAGHPDLMDVLWLGFGWALGDVTCGIYQNYLNLYQYHEGSLPGDDNILSAAPWAGYRAGDIITSASTDGGYMPFTNGGAEDHYEAQLEVELSRLASLKARLELEDIYGIPFAEIPPIIISIQWLDALLLSLGLTLIMSHPFMLSGTIGSTIPIVAVTWAIHSCLALGYALAMPRIGVHAVNYFGLMVSIGCLVAGLARWGVLE